MRKIRLTIIISFSVPQFSMDVYACARTADCTMVQVLDTWNILGSRQNLRDDNQSDIQTLSAEFV